MSEFCFFYQSYLLLQEGEQEPFDIGVQWAKLTFLPYSGLGSDEIAASITMAIEDNHDSNWEVKVYRIENYKIEGYESVND